MKSPANKAARPDGRAVDALRPIRFTPDLAPAAAGSVLVEFGRTRVICGASIEDGVPRWMRAQNVTGGWLTAEYSILPYATSPRNSRESSTGKVSGRTQEIQRLIGRSLRAVTNLDKLGERTIWLDCDVLEADGGTRTAALTGAWVALRRAVNKLLKDGALKEDPLREAVAAVSVGIVEGRPLLDLCYTEDLAAAVDLNVVMTESDRFVEVQGTAEENPFSREELDRMLALAARGIRKLLKAQEAHAV